MRKFSMFTPFLTILFVAAAMFTSCEKPTTEIMWVAGYKADCDAGAGKASCLLVNKGEDPYSSDWEYFYAPIEGFGIEDGWMKKIKVSVHSVPEDEIAQDASTLRYAFLEELDNQADPRPDLSGGWLLAKINDGPIDRSIILPTLTLNVADRSVSGFSGCNTYAGRLKSLSPTELTFGTLASTKKACISKTIESEYLTTLSETASFEISGNQLILKNEADDHILTFIVKDDEANMQRLQDIWVTVRMDGHPINRMIPLPRLEFDLSAQRISGTDGCNDFTGSIDSVTTEALSFSGLAVTEKACREMEAAEQFRTALGKVAGYQLNQLQLILYDQEGNEVLAFLKAD